MKTQTIQTTRTKTYHDLIASRARQIWEASGRPTGRDLENWLQAEREISTSHFKSPSHLDRSPAQARV